LKIRLDFVSNSSSSSYIIDETGCIESGYDAGLDDFDLVECVNGHILEEDHVIKNDDMEIDDFDEIPKEYCPICQMKTASIFDVYKYAFKKLGMSYEELKKEMLENYCNYEELKKDLSKVKIILPGD